MISKISAALVLAAVFAMAATSSAFAAAPVNDMRASATTLTVPQKVSGTTVEATTEDGEPVPGCASTGPESVWYSLAGKGKRVALSLDANGDLDAVVAVYAKDRSETSEIECAATDKKGLGVLAFKAKSGTDYLIRVSSRKGSVQGTFSLTTAAAADPQDFPGKKLPSNGVSRTVDLARNPGDVWSVHLRAGTTYRFNLATSSEGYCVTAGVFAKSGDGDRVARLACNNGYTLFTPAHGESGRYSIAVDPGRGTLATQKYHLQAGRAGSDDTGPGRVWGGKSIHGHLDGRRIDVEDLYNWDLTQRAEVDLRVTGGYHVELRSAGGRYLGCNCGDGFSRKLQPGTYFASVFASDEEHGSYKLRRVVRSITHTSVTFNGGSHALAAPGQSVSITGMVFPASSGALQITLERKDPVYGWQFERRYDGSGSGGAYSVSFVPPGVGEWRAKAEFKGSSSANPSSSKFAHLSVRR